MPTQPKHHGLSVSGRSHISGPSDGAPRPATPQPTFQRFVQTPSDERFPVYTRANVRDVFPGVIRPLDWSIVGRGFDQEGGRGFAWDLHLLDASTDPGPPGYLLQRLYRGRAYVNLSYVIWMFERLSRSTARAVEEQVISARPDLLVLRPPAPDLRTRLRLLPGIIAGVPVLFQHWRHRTDLQEEVGSLREGLDPSRLDNQNLRRAMEELIPRLYSGLGGQVRVGTIAVMMMDKLVPLIRRLAKDQDGARTLAAIIEAGASEERHGRSEPPLVMRAQARRVTQIPGLAEVVAAAQPGEVLSVLDKQAPEVAVALRHMLHQHGHRSPGELQITAKSWAEDPTPLLHAFQSLVMGSRDALEETEVGKVDALTELTRGLPPWRQILLRLTVSAARTCVGAREEPKEGAVLAIDALRRCAREAGLRLREQGLIEEPDDVDYLTFDELASLLSSTPIESVRERVRVRRLDVLELEAGPEPPDLLVLDVSADANLEATQSPIITGLGVSAGLFEGLARVVIHGDDAALLEANEVLVARYTDAGWTPYMSLAGALVIETGGLLSHGAIVARELGLPAVVSATGALDRIQTGDRLLVNATTGDVEILKQAGGTS